MRGYVDGLEAILLKSQERGDKGDVKSLGFISPSRS